MKRVFEQKPNELDKTHDEAVVAAMTADVLADDLQAMMGIATSMS